MKRSEAIDQLREMDANMSNAVTSCSFWIISTLSVRSSSANRSAKAKPSATPN